LKIQPICKDETEKNIYYLYFTTKIVAVDITNAYSPTLTA